MARPLQRRGVRGQSARREPNRAGRPGKPFAPSCKGIALLRAEDDLQIGNRPFLRFHPTLAIAAADATLAQKPETRQRFLSVYLALMRALDKALQRLAIACRAGNPGPRGGELPHRRPLGRGRSATPTAAMLGDTFAHYLERSGRLRERDAWVQWLRDAVTQPGFTEEAAAYEREHAWTRFTQGDPQGAVDQLQALIERLRHTTEFDPAFQLATTTTHAGPGAASCGAAAQAIPIPAGSGRSLGAVGRTRRRPTLGSGCWTPAITPKPPPSWATSPPRWAIWPMR